ncbi:MAG: hypothetical protein CMK46_02745 [Porticoccus sp.]|uniref:class I SAM-dependent methyltransferase n=1 Tax=Porticoccus hydrocarbonoclasticus TaxID=1073414 RepID=UPI000C4AAF40|nr:class I SAM-dependent methyltransferase [Porticoccus hydrocarbonoclasticus]MBG57188.1 hypothetical protein [Porticoccus sp.]|tara:strand:- start:4686 stop:5360 length:675 start_codon:yes stop_codon:yes gene_type:complete
MADNDGIQCPLCDDRAVAHYWSDRQRDYLQCAHCQLVFVPSGQQLSPAQEKSHYDLHENNPGDQRYRAFLGRLCTPLMDRLAPGSRGLDFGAGPGPTLSVILQEAGFDVAIYDIYYAPDRSVLAKRYDFITATEVVEHLSHPGEVLGHLWTVLEPGGWLGLMTKLVRDKVAFERWHYKNDPTHISFFSFVTMDYLRTRWGASIERLEDDVILFRKPDRGLCYEL